MIEIQVEIDHIGERVYECVVGGGAEITIDLNQETDGDIEYCLIQHGGDIDSDEDIVLALLMDRHYAA